MLPYLVKDDGLETAEFVRVHSIIVDGSDHLGVTSLRFDDHEELVWMGNQCGHVTSYYGPEMNKYTSFQVHDTLHDVRFIQTYESTVLILLSDLVGTFVNICYVKIIVNYKLSLVNGYVK